MVPITLKFDGAENVQGGDIVHFPKLNQSAPYSFGLKVRLEDNSYRNWSEAVEVRWRIKLRPSDKHELLTLLKSAGNFTVAADTLTFIVKASDWVGIELPQSSNHLEVDVPFSYVIEFLNAVGSGGVVTERFAHGSGFITVDLFQ